MGRRHVSVALGLVLWLGLWLYLGLTVFKLGPHRFDDFRYTYNALAGTFDQGIRFRYVHVWVLRGFYGVVGDRITAAAAYATVVHLGLVGTAFALAHRAGGLLGAAFAAWLLPFYPPLLNFISTPLTDPPCTLYGGLAILAALPDRTGEVSPRRALMAGLLCFASVKCKETGIAVVPVLLFLLGQHPARRRRMWGMLLAGGVLGQVLLCVADLAITGHAFQSLRVSVFETYTGTLSGAPKVSKSGRNLMREEWLQLLLSRGVAGFTLLGLAGLAWGVRRNVTVAALAAWGACILLFSAWVSWRYSGIDAHIRYLGPLGLPLVAAAGPLLGDLFRMPSIADPRRTGVRSGGLWLVCLCAAGFAWVGARGLWAGGRMVFELGASYSDRRAEFFLLPLVVPLGLLLAWSSPMAWLRRAVLALVLMAPPLLALPQTRAYLARERREIATWHKLAGYMEDHRIDRLARYETLERHVSRKLLTWRILSLSNLEPAALRIDDVDDLAQVGRDDLLMIDMNRRAALDQAREQGWKGILSLRRNKRRLFIFRHASRIEAELGHAAPQGGTERKR